MPDTTKVTIVALPESSMMTLSSVIDPLRAANRLSRQPLFCWQIISLDGQAIELTCGIQVQSDGVLNASQAGEVFIVVGGFNHQQHTPTNSLPVLRNAASKHNTIIGVEAGTWVLARAGIIDQQTVTTHWEDLENLAFAYPGLQVLGQRYVIDQHVWTSGGASPALDMMLHYIRTTQNRSLALDVASVFIYNESSAASDAQAIVSLGRIEQAEPRVAQAIKLMENHIEEPLSIQAIAKQLKLSVRSLELLYKKILNASPKAYYLRLRLQSARRLLLDSNSSILNVSVRSGFNSHAAFTRAFKQRYKQSPLQLRNSAR